VKTRLLSVLALTLFIAMVLFAATGKGQILGPSGPTACFTYSPTAPMPGDIIVFDASSSYATSGNIVNFAWDFGDGTVQASSSPTTTHSYLLDGTYTVQLTVTDNNGATDSSTAVVDVSTITFFRVVIAGTLTPLSNVKVTAYVKILGSWVAIPPSPCTIEVKYDNMTQPNLARTWAERYRNPGYTASVLRNGASNIGFDIHPACWDVFFKFEWGSYVAYWPNDTSQVYSYKNGGVESHNYPPGHEAEWDSSASTYVIDVNNIPRNGVCPTESHPIIVGLLCPPPPVQYYLSVNTSPTGLPAIPGQGWYNKGTNVVLTAPNYENTTSTSRYRFSYWDLDGTQQSIGLNPITVAMLGNHTATAHYVLQYPVAFSQTGLSSDATGTVVTINGTAKTYSDLPFTYWVDSSDVITYTYNPTVSSSISGKQYRSSSVTGPSSPIVVSSSTTVYGNYVAQYLITFAQTGLDATATGTMVTVNATSKTYTQLPYSFWVDSGKSITYAYNTTISSSTTGKQFILLGITGPSSPITITSPTNVTGNYKTQYRLTVTSPYDSPTPNSGWFDSNSNITEFVTSPVLGGAGTRYICTGWTGTGNIPSSGSGTSVTFTITQASSITWNWKTQYQVTFSQSGVGSDFLGTVVTVDSVNYGVSSLPFSVWYDSGSAHSFSFASPLTVGSKQYAWSSTSGLSNLQGGTLTVTASGSVIANYLVQNQVTFDQIGVNSDFTGTVITIDSVAYTKTQLPVMFSWSIGSNHSFAFQSPLIVGSNTTQYIWTSTTGLTSLQSGSITITTYGSIIGNYKTQYYFTVSSPYGSPTPLSSWFDLGSIITESVSSPVSGGPNLQYACIGWTGTGSVPSSGSSSSITFTITQASSITWNWKIQYQVTFKQAGVGPDFTGTVVIIDSNPYTASLLPASFWFDSGSNHNFSYNSPLVVNATQQYNWLSTTGLTTLQTGTLTITGSGSVTGNYATETMFQVTFTQTGLASDFTGTVLTVDGANYGVTDLPVSFWWSASSVHTFSYQSPLLVTPNVQQYVWTSTSGLTTSQTGSLTISSSGSISGNYKTQYYLAVVTDPPGIGSPSGTGWFDPGANVTINAPGYVNIVPGSSRYRFNGWTTTNMSEIGDPSRSPTTIIIDEGKNVTANYVVQYFVTINQTGVGSDFTGTIVTIDTIDFNGTSLPVTFAWDNGTTHTFEFHSPLLVTPSTKQYVWTGTTGLSANQDDTVTATTFGSITGIYNVQYYVSVGTNPPGIATIPGEGWYNQSAVVTLTAPTVPNYTFDRWYINGAPQGAGMNPITITMNAAFSTQAYYNATAPYVLTITTTSGGTTNPSPGAYNYTSGQNVQVTAIANSGYILDHWEYDGTNVSASNNPYTVTMNTNHNLKAVFLPAPSPPTVSISPMNSTINLGQSLQFTSTVTGGQSPYQYQWYSDGAPVSGATADTWTFTPTNYGLHFVHLKITDALNNTVYSADASIIVIGPPPIGGYTVPLSLQKITMGITAYAFLLGTLSVVLVSIKRKRK